MPKVNTKKELLLCINKHNQCAQLALFIYEKKPFKILNAIFTSFSFSQKFIFLWQITKDKFVLRSLASDISWHFLHLISSHELVHPDTYFINPSMFKFVKIKCRQPWQSFCENNMEENSFYINSLWNSYRKSRTQKKYFSTNTTKIM